MSEFVKFIALRYFSQSRKRGKLSFISLISVFGLALGAATLITVFSVMDGLIKKMEDVVLESTSHANVYKVVGNFDNYEEIAKKLETIPGVIGAAPVIYNEVLLTRGKEISGAILNGVDVKNYNKIANLKGMVVDGDFDCLLNKSGCDFDKSLNDRARQLDDFLGEENEIRPIILGSDLARKLKAETGSMITIITLKGSRVIGEDSVPVSGNFFVAAIFETGMNDYDSRYLYATLEDTQNFLQMGRHASFVSLRVDNAQKIDDFKEMIFERTGGFPFSVQDWKDMHKTTFKFLHLQKIIMFIILIFIILVASFGIITTLIMMILGKTREISILRSLGATKGVITRIFMLNGFIIGLIGTLLGALLAVCVCWALQKIEFPISKEIYFFSTLPVELSFSSFAIVMVSTLIISIIATLYPSVKASGITPVEGLRHE